MELEYAEKELLGLQPTVNPVGARCYMELRHSTFGNLPTHVWESEAKEAREVEKMSPGYLRSCARSFKIEDRFDEYEKIKAKFIAAVARAMLEFDEAIGLNGDSSVSRDTARQLRQKLIPPIL